MQTRRILSLATGFLIFSTQAGATPPRTIYRCKAADAAVTFSDRPCAAGAQEYEADSSRVSTYAPPPVAQAKPVKAQQKQRPRKATSRSALVTQAKQAADCARLNSSLRDIRSKMRSGYGAKEGERLRERQEKLEQRRRAQRCR